MPNDYEERPQKHKTYCAGWTGSVCDCSVTIVEDEWPRIERGLIRASEDIYFRDFLRSLWKRLTKRSPA